MHKALQAACCDRGNAGRRVRQDVAYTSLVYKLMQSQTKGDRTQYEVDGLRSEVITQFENICFLFLQFPIV